MAKNFPNRARLANANPEEMAKAPQPELTIDITSLCYGPYGLGHWQGKTIMVADTVPGDRIVARVVDSMRRYSVGTVVRLITPSPLRQNPACPYVDRCGGCSWQHVGYQIQLSAKQQSVEDALRRIGKLDEFEMRPIIPADHSYHYRRRIRLQNNSSGRLAFYGAHSHDLVTIDSCAVADERINLALAPLSAWLTRLHSAIVELEIITGDEPDERVVVAHTARPLEVVDESNCAELVNGNDCISGLVIVQAQGRQTWGKPWITINLTDELSVILDADVFTQVNAAGNRRMIRQLLALGNFNFQDLVLELYCGAGNFTLPLATRVKHLVAVEGNRRAVANGKLNARKNRLDNIEWHCAPVPQALAWLKRRRQKFAKIVLDPPRAGAKGIAAELAPLGAEAICYLSCNPTTMARDLAALSRHGYKLRVVQPIDFFPHTFHVESLAVMSR